MEDVQRLINLAEWKGKKPERTVRLGEVLAYLVEGRIQPLHARLGPVLELWDQLLPEELARHCRIETIVGRELKVAAASPAHLHELRMCVRELLAELRRQCPQAKIRNIRLTLDQTRV